MADLTPAEGYERAAQFCGHIEKVILGKTKEVRQVVAGLLGGGHVLVEDIPGVGKTTLARALAQSLACTFRRIQFTPDLLPADILGVSIYNAKVGEFEFKAGPIFGSILLADEINRTTPRTQSALLEAMNIGQVTLDGKTHPLPQPFFVIATQNPLEYTGTYPLPESQLDRFSLCLRLGYPEAAQEREILASRKLRDPLDDLTPILTAKEILEMIELVKQIRVDEVIYDYLQAIMAKTRTHPRLLLGSSPRAALSLFRLAQAWAFLHHRDFVLPDDIKELAVPALAHRIVLREQGMARETATARAAVIAQILEQVPVPV